MEVTGRLIQKLTMQSGVGKSGSNWQKQEFVIETTDSQYPQKICASLWGDKTDMLNSFNIGDTVVVSFDISSREYNGKWYTDVRAWKIALAGQPQGTAAAPAQPVASSLPDSAPEVTTFTDTASDEGVDDLPF